MMKYGLLAVPWGHNIGDALQSRLIRDMYAERGISDIKYLELGRTAEYEGDKLILPMNSCNVYSGPHDARKFASSKDVDYRYVGFHLHGNLSTFGKSVGLVSEYPIGCRDVPTRDFLRKLGYNAYFSGCVSMTLPRRQDGDYKLVYVIDDDPKKALPLCDPVDIRVLTSLCLPDGIPWRDAEDLAMRRMELLRDTAKMVITSRLHVYLPCVAMGIPVVFTRPIIPRTSLVEIFTPATVGYFRDIVRQNIVNALFDEGECVAKELDELAILGDRPFDK